jgi:2-isopropylmalate synthase
LHGSAVAKDPRTYEHVPPDAVGNVRHVLVSNQAGRANVVARLSESGIEISADDPRLTTLISDMKEREHLGYAYDGAEASFELMALRAMGTLPDYFLVKSFRVIVERRYNAKGDLVTTSDATVKSVVDGEIFMSVGEGNGPVNALDDALRKDLGKYSAFLEDLELVDFKVRILSQGTGAVTRVMLESLNGAGERWTTVGVSANIIDASFQALYDAMVYKLFRAEAPPARPKAAE